MIGVTALAFTVAVILASTAVLLVGAAGFSLYSALEPGLGAPAAAGIVSIACALFLLIVLLIANTRGQGVKPKPDADGPAYQQIRDLVALFTDTVKERPLLALGLTTLTGFLVTRDANLLRDLLHAALRKQDEAPRR